MNYSKIKKVFKPKGIVVLVFFLMFCFAGAWSEPTETPPAGNASAPINVSGNPQYKTGAFGVEGTLSAYSQICLGDPDSGTQECISSWPSGGTGGLSSCSDCDDYFQKEITDSCSAGSSIRVINDDGSVVCETDDVGSSGGGGSDDGYIGDSGSTHVAGAALNMNGYSFHNVDNVNANDLYARTMSASSGWNSIEIKDRVNIQGSNGGVSLKTNDDIWADADIYADAFLYGSDKRLKKNIETLESNLDNVLKLRSVSFDWKNATDGDKKKLGLIAQEVEEVYPEVVFTNEETGLKSIDYVSLVSPLIGSVQEQQLIIKNQSKEIEELKLMVKELQEEIKNIK